MQITTKYLVITGSKNNTVRRMYIPMSHFLTEHTSFRSLGRSEVSCRTRILRRFAPGASKQGLLQSLGHGQGTEKSAAAVSHGAMPPPQPRNRPGHARLSGRRQCMPPVVQAGRAAEPPQ